LTHALINGSIEIPCDYLILAPGNSSRDTFEMLEKRGVLIESKSFAIGLRVEHPQELINEIQYGVPYDASLPVADYSLTYNDLVSGRSLYSFCMCPGGLVVAGSSELEGVVTNGMSNFLRNSPYANSALVVTVGKDDFVSGSPLGGVYFQREMESAAFRIAGGDYSAPAQSLISFIGGKPSGKIRSSYSPGVKEADLSELFPDVITRTLRDGIHHFNKKMRGFITSEATLTGVESRTSSPVRIIRGESLQSPSMEGLYPVGEGAGYAGGIMSAALDGIRVADAIVSSLSP
jgi:uncharacterized FAD-dependent dehydrogenase